MNTVFITQKEIVLLFVENIKIIMQLRQENLLQVCQKKCRNLKIFLLKRV